MKSPWSEVKLEMCEEKGLDPAVADKIGEYVKYKGLLIASILRVSTHGDAGGEELLDTLLTDSTLTANARAKEGLSEMSILFRLLRAYKIMDKVGNLQFMCQE